MAANAFIFFIAGFETTSSTISYCLYELAKNEEIQECLYKEILDAVNKKEGIIDYSLLNMIPLLDMVIDGIEVKYFFLKGIQKKLMTKC